MLKMTKIFDEKLQWQLHRLVVFIRSSFFSSLSLTVSDTVQFSSHIWKWRKCTKIIHGHGTAQRTNKTKTIINNNNTWEINNKEKTVHTKKETQNIRVSRDTPRMLEYVLSVRCLQTNSSTYVKVSYSLAYSQSTLRSIHNSIPNYYNQPERTHKQRERESERQAGRSLNFIYLQMYYYTRLVRARYESKCVCFYFILLLLLRFIFGRSPTLLCMTHTHWLSLIHRSLITALYFILCALLALHFAAVDSCIHEFENPAHANRFWPYNSLSACDSWMNFLCMDFHSHFQYSKKNISALMKWTAIKINSIENQF